MSGIYINCRVYPFIAWILSGVKLYETRTRNTLRALIGQRVALIETGTGHAPTVRGYATIASAERIEHSDTEARKAARILGTSYDIRPGGAKVFYKLEDVQPCTPYPVPADRVNHGRSWTTYTEPKEA